MHSQGAVGDGCCRLRFVSYFRLVNVEQQMQAIRGAASSFFFFFFGVLDGPLDDRQSPYLII